MLTQDQAKEFFDYNPETGVVVRRKTFHKGHQCKLDVPIGTVTSGGYLVASIKNRKVLIHRFIFLYMTGSFPAKEIDHINGIKTDNRWCNLRESTHTENICNSNKPNNSSGYKGVSLNQQKTRWIARCRANNKENYLGSFDDPELAANVYRVFARENHGKFFKDQTA